MANTQQFSLRWNNYLNHITGAFDALRTDEDLVDVTLSCEGRKIKAHKMLLSACSSYFREIFKENPCQHPVIIFWNVKFDDLQALVTFMYQGEVSVTQECLSSFLNTAELLEVQGLTSGPSKETCDAKSDEMDSIVGGIEGAKRGKKHAVSQKNVSSAPDDSPPGKKKKRASPSSEASPTDNNTLSERRRLIKEEEPESYDNDSEETFDELNWCDNLPLDPAAKYPVGSNEDSREGLSNLDRGPGTSSDTAHDSLQVLAHGLWRRLHPSLKQFGCDECGKVFKHPRSLDHHKKMHEGRTTCPVCCKVFGRMYALRLHMSSSHPDSSHSLLQKAK